VPFPAVNGEDDERSTYVSMFDRELQSGQILVRDDNFPLRSGRHNSEPPPGYEVVSEYSTQKLHTTMGVFKANEAELDGVIMILIQCIRHSRWRFVFLYNLGGKCDLDLRSHILGAPHVNLTVDASGLHDAVHDGESEPGACLHGILLGKGMKKLILKKLISVSLSVSNWALTLRKSWLIPWSSMLVKKKNSIWVLIDTRLAGVSDD
jgi:hypothetical protein